MKLLPRHSFAQKNRLGPASERGCRQEPKASRRTLSKHGYQHSRFSAQLGFSGDRTNPFPTGGLKRFHCPGTSVGRFGALPPAGTTARLGPPPPRAPKPAPHLRRVSAAELPASRARAAAGAAPAAERNGHVSSTTANRPARPAPPVQPRHSPGTAPEPHLAARPAPGPAPPPPPTSRRDTDGQGHGAEAESATTAALPPGAEAREELPGDGSGSVGGIGECPAAPGAG